MKGKYPAILKSEKYGKEAKKLFDDANDLIDAIIKNNSLTANAVFGLFPANSNGDDITVYKDESRKSMLTTLHMLRQQIKKADGAAKLIPGGFYCARKKRTLLIT